jgi:outer membrane receptor for ferrienterochelin and colicins
VIRALVVVALLAGTARAQGVDVQDLPPLPAAEDEPSSSATLLAAQAAEEDVVVGAAKREQSLGNVASAVTVVSGDRIRRFGYRTIGEAVAGVAGAYLVDNRLSYSIGIRGMQIPGDFNTRILVLVDGASVNEAWGAFAGIGFDAIVGIEDIARIEVIRGPVSSVYGTNAFFGIINIVTRGAAETPRAWARTGVNSINGVTTSAGFAAGGVDRQIRGSVHFMNRFGETFAALPDGGDANAGSADGSQSIAAGVIAAYGGSFLQVRANRYDRQSPFAPYDVFPGAGAYQQVDRQLIVEGGHTATITKRLALAGRIYASAYKFSDSSPPSDPVTAQPLDTSGAAQTYGAEVRGRYELIAPDRLGITAGTEASYNRTRSTAFVLGGPPEDTIDIPVNFTLQGVYTEVDAAPTSWLGFTGGLRFDRNSRLENRLSPRAALFVQKPEAYGVKLLYAEGFRNASMFEAFFEDGEDFAADPDSLRAETIRSLETVLWAKPAPGLALRLSGFYWDARDILEEEDSEILPGAVQFANATRYVSTGVEAEASYRNSAGWYVFGGACVSEVGTEDDMGELVYGGVVNAPLLTAAAGVSTPRLWGRAHVSTEGLVIGRRPTREDATMDPPVPSPDSPAWFGWNVNVYAPDVYGFDVSAGVRNLIGVRDLMPAPGDYDRSELETRTVPRVPGEGRELYVKVGYSY